MDRPIIFNTEMVKAALERRKTQTRRVMDFPKSYMWNNERFKKNYTFDKMFFDDWKNRNVAIFTDGKYTEWFKCPYGKVGDRLWVKETFSEKIKNLGLSNLEWTRHIKDFGKCFYKSDDCQLLFNTTWTPSIHMPRWASRITLKITDIRVERLQDIKYEGMKAEGCLPKNCCGGERETLRKEYWIPLWNSIYKKENTWQDNPWVWVIEFKVI